jgi:iron-sulfur cluster repair protein YtfE (RIC family)
VDKPWGYELIWAHTDRYVGKILHIRAGESLSLQFHRRKDETIMLLAGRMRFEHDEHGERLARLEHLAHHFELPEEACATWRALYTGVQKLIDDVHEHVHLENNVLFPRYAG